MNDNAKKWVEALRSGKYQQAQKKLRVGDAFCCLGVACELYREATGEGEWTAHEGEDQSHDFTAPLRGYPEHSDTALPWGVREWLGLHSSEGHYGPGLVDGGNESLAALNDRGFSFTDIANLIESEPDGLFMKEGE